VPGGHGPAAANPSSARSLKIKGCCPCFPATPACERRPAASVGLSPQTLLRLRRHVMPQGAALGAGSANPRPRQAGIYDWKNRMDRVSSQQRRVRPFLTQNTFLGRLPAVVLDALLGKGRIRKYAKGDVVYRRGDRGDSLMVVIAGRAKLTNVSVGAREVVLHFLGAGDIFGEIAALDGRERAAHAVALADLEVFVIYTRDLLPTLIAHPEAMLEVICALCEKVRLGASIIEDNTLEMHGRLARGLLRLARQHGRTSADGVCLEMTISQQELGKYLDLSRANVSRKLGQLKAAGVVRIEGARIIITQADALAEIGAARAPQRADRPRLSERAGHAPTAADG